MPARRVIILGSTGSVGTQTLDTIGHLNRLHARDASPTRFEVVGLAAGSASPALKRQAEAWPHARVAVADPEATTHHLRGPDAAEQLVRAVDCDVIVSAIVGTAGLRATFAGVQLGRDVALANKETLVAAGPLVTAEARRTGARLLPLDSEHAAAWQCLTPYADTDAPPWADTPRVSRLILTASGGPFRTQTHRQCYDAAPEQALRHPTWNMGRKNTIDSASLINKALELIEAHHLFALPAHQLDILIHPQSIVHALIELPDHSLIAHLAAPDMRLPIQQALTHPERIESPIARADLAALSDLTFEPADPERWPAVDLARRAIEARGAAGAVLNGANEAAVEAFLDPAGPRIPFGRIPELVALAMDELAHLPLTTLDDADHAAAEARRLVETHIDTPARAR